VAIVLLSAVLHAYWNLLFKKSRDKALFSFLYIWAGMLLYTPLFLIAVPSAGIPWQGWMCILATGSVYCFYFLLLGRSYAHGDLSHSYPIARGLAPVLTLTWALVFLGERPSTIGSAGILFVILSVYLFHPPAKGALSPAQTAAKLATPASAAAISTGLCISLYQVIDKVGVSFVDPVPYLYLTFTVCGLILSPFFLRRYGLTTMRTEASATWRQALLVGFLCIFSYLLVLFAMRAVEVSYVISLRSTSIMFAVLFGFEILGEERTNLKILAAAVMTMGVAFIAIS